MWPRRIPYSWHDILNLGYELIRVGDDQKCAQNILLQELKFEVFAGPIYVECLHEQCSNSYGYRAGVHRPPTETYWYHHHSQGLASELLHSWLDSLGEKAPLFLVALRENVKYFSLAVLWQCAFPLLFLSAFHISDIPFHLPVLVTSQVFSPFFLSLFWMAISDCPIQTASVWCDVLARNCVGCGME